MNDLTAASMAFVVACLVAFAIGRIDQRRTARRAIERYERETEFVVSINGHVLMRGTIERVRLLGGLYGENGANEIVLRFPSSRDASAEALRRN